jgi:hypothetical protein
MSAAHCLFSPMFINLMGAVRVLVGQTIVSCRLFRCNMGRRPTNENVENPGFRARSRLASATFTGSLQVHLSLAVTVRAAP